MAGILDDVAGILHDIGSAIDPASLLISPVYATAQAIGTQDQPATPGTSPSDYLLNLTTGHLTQDQVDELQSAGDASITQAAAGNQELAQSQIAQWHKDLAWSLNQSNAAPMKPTTWLFIAVLIVGGTWIVLDFLD